MTISFLFTVDGSWGNWHSWSWCSTSCGGGEKTRKRLCNNPIPSKSGRPCPGDATQVSRCNIQVCPGKQLHSTLAGPHLQTFCELKKKKKWCHSEPSNYKIVPTLGERGFPGGSVVKNSLVKQEHRFDPWVGKIPWRRKWQSTPVFLPGKSHGERSLMGYSPWGCKELDTT